MTTVPTQDDGDVRLRQREDGLHVLGIRADGLLSNVVLDDAQLAMLGRIAVARAIPDAPRDAVKETEP